MHATATEQGSDVVRKWYAHGELSSAWQNWSHHTSFGEMVERRDSLGLARPGGFLNYGFYNAHLDSWGQVLSSRKQILVVSMESHLMADPRGTMRAVTKHYGLPELTHVDFLPKENTQTSPAKIHAIACETRDELAAYYEPYNAQLEVRLDVEQSSGLSPEYEAPWHRFDPSRVACFVGQELRQ